MKVRKDGVGDLIYRGLIKEARAKLLAAYREAGTIQGDAAVILGCAATTFVRWADDSKARVEMVKMRAQAKREGWAAEERRGRPAKKTAS